MFAYFIHVYPGNSIEKNSSILEISVFVAVCILNVSTRICTTKNKLAEGFLDTKGL